MLILYFWNKINDSSICSLMLQKVEEIFVKAVLIKIEIEQAVGFSFIIYFNVSDIY